MCGHPRVQNSKKNAGIRELEVGGDCLMCQVLHAIFLLMSLTQDGDHCNVWVSIDRQFSVHVQTPQPRSQAVVLENESLGMRLRVQ